MQDTDESPKNIPSFKGSEGTLMASLMTKSAQNPPAITTYNEALDSLDEDTKPRLSSPAKDRYADHDLDLSRQLYEMNAYVNDYNSKFDSNGKEKLKLKINLGKVDAIEELKKENARLIDRQAKEIK